MKAKEELDKKTAALAKRVEQGVKQVKEQTLKAAQKAAEYAARQKEELEKKVAAAAKKVREFLLFTHVPHSVKNYCCVSLRSPKVVRVHYTTTSPAPPPSLPNMIYCCNDMDTSFRFPRVSTLRDAARGNDGSSKSVRPNEYFSIWTSDLDDPPFPRAASERVETWGNESQFNLNTDSIPDDREMFHGLGRSSTDP